MPLSLAGFVLPSSVLRVAEALLYIVAGTTLKRLGALTRVDGEVSHLCPLVRNRLRARVARGKRTRTRV